jgi:hypothetical protein
MSRMVPMTYPHSDEVADVELLPDQVAAFEAVGWQRKPVDPDSPPSPLPPVAQSSLGDAPERAEVGQPVGLVDDGDLADDQTAPGSYGGDTGKLTCYRDTKTALDLAYSTLVDGAVGFLVVFRFGCAQDANGKGTPSGTATVGDRCEVWPATIISRAPMPIGDGKATTFDVSIAFTDSPNTDALVA